MALITTTAFLLAVRLNAMVVAILGMLGGFLTPALLSSGQDNPLGLFVYIALLDGRGCSWSPSSSAGNFLAAMAALCTALMQAGWAESFFTREKVFRGATRSISRWPCCWALNALWLAGKLAGQTPGAIQ